MPKPQRPPRTFKPLPTATVTLDKIVGGGQAMGTLTDGDDNGRKIFVWGGLPGETVEVQITKKRSHLAEGVVSNVIEASKDRVEARDPDSFLSTSPWQIMDIKTELHYKAALIEEAFELHDIVLPNAIEVYSDGNDYEYRNKVEFSWYWNNETNRLDLSFFRRGTHGKIPVDGTSLADPAINEAGRAIRNLFNKKKISGYDLKTLLIRTNELGDVIAQCYVKKADFAPLSEEELKSLPIAGFEVIFSNPKSPASVITERLQQWGDTALTDTISGVDFTYATEGFFQINLPVYEQSLLDIRKWVAADLPVVDLYSGVGTIGLTVTENPVTLVELNPSAVGEMRRNIESLGRTNATAVLAASEQALDYITGDATIIVDPPRAGLHQDVVTRLLAEKPERIIYLSCNPVTQARDIALLAAGYGIESHRGYNFFPHTPHIEHLVVLTRLATA